MDDTVHPEALAPPAPVEEEDGEWAPTDAALEVRRASASGEARGGAPSHRQQPHAGAPPKFPLAAARDG